MYLAFLIVFLLFTLVLVFVISSAFFGFLRTRVPFVPTSRKDIEYIIKKINLKPTEVFFDLGSGNGKVCFFAEELSGAKVVGFELTRWTHFFARVKACFKNSKAKFIRKDFFKENWSEADVIYCYLYPPLMRRIEEKFLGEMKPGSKAVVRDFPFPTLSYQEKIYRPDNHEIYIYVK